MPEELSSQAENDLHELGWYKVGLSIENVKFIIQEAMKYPEDPARIRVLIEQAVKGTVLGTAKTGEPVVEISLLAPVLQRRPRTRSTVYEAPLPIINSAVNTNADFDITTTTLAPENETHNHWYNHYLNNYGGMNGNNNSES